MIITLLCLIASQQGFSQSVAIDSLSSLRGVSVLSQDVVWVSGSRGVIAKTENGGLSWRQLKIPKTEDFEFRDIEVFNKKEVLVMSAGVGAKSNIYRTQDGGENWDLVYANTFEKGFFNGFSFKDRKSGVLTGDPVDGKLFVLSTSDGGKSWDRIDSELLIKLDSGEIGGFSASGSHLYYGNGLFVNGTGGKSSRMHIADDNLSEWEVKDTPIIQGESSQGIFSVDFCNTEVGVGVGGDYTKESVGRDNVVITRNGGDNWELADVFPVYQSSVRFVNCDFAISTGPDGTYQSKDAGKTWIKMMEYPGFHALDIGDDDSVWAVGSRGRVMRIE